MSNNKKKNDAIAQQCEQIRSRASMFDRGHIMNDYDLFIAASTILLCTGKMSESEMDDVTSCAFAGSRQALPFLLSKVETLGHKAFFSALGYIRRLNEYQAAHIENWYTSESKRAYAYKRRRREREYFDRVDNPPIGGHDPTLDEEIKARGTIESQYPKLPKITIGEFMHVPSSTTTTTTHKRRKHNANSTITIPRPAKGCIYTDEEQWNIIKKYPKGSPERSEVIRLMTQEQYVKSKATLYRHIKKSEDDERVKMTQQLKPSHTPRCIDASTLGLGYKGDYIRPNVRDVVNEKSSMFLTVIPVSFAESRDMDSLDMSRSYYIDICKVIGNSDRVELCSSDDWNCIQGKSSNAPDHAHFTRLCQEKRILPLKWVKLLDGEKQHRISKLYLPPSTFPPPTSDTTQHNTILGHLRNYIKTEASLGQLPVVCSGDNDFVANICTKEGCNLNMRRKIIRTGTLTICIRVHSLL